ncbi:MAG: type II toxin-antitoxin system VapB family antitoxin [Bryobacteraceae bacterium]
MAFNIKNPRADRLARQLAAKTGESLTEAVIRALSERLERVETRQKRRPLADELDEIAVRCASLPVSDPRPADEILGYDERGLPR